jgi:mRNA-degrading endonuclease RelE of RelBE toxin-antitoxin system
MFDIKFTNCAIEDLGLFPKSEQKWIVTALESKLKTGAAKESGDRKRLRLKGAGGWEIRLGDVRVFYNVDMVNEMVKIEAIGRRFFL